MEALSRCGAIVCDLDGTLCLEERPIHGAGEFLYQVIHSGRQLYYFTNNNSLSRKTWVAKLAAMNFPVQDQQLMTSADCADAYLKQHDLYPRIYLVGNADLQQEFTSRGYLCLDENEALRDEPHAVVLGFDTELDYKKICTCYDLILRDVPYVATHPDVLCPVTRRTFKPDVGSFISLFETATQGRRPVIVGKPTPQAARFIIGKTRLPAQRIAFIGDRLYTDIRMAVTCGMTGVLVLSGETTAEMVSTSQDQPHIIVNSVAELVQYL
ncbi:HAD-IIA family hydrolase [candidate division KSB1 bacterium]|nr:HAD-IIA family hydrolase [candidate division KSB1 bacterium]